jgi:hypothetical protein
LADEHIITHKIVIRYIYDNFSHYVCAWNKRIEFNELNTQIPVVVVVENLIG